VLLVFAATERHPYNFYTALRWICCAVFVYFAFTAHDKNRVAWTWIFGVLAVLYNPIFRVHLDRSTWTGVNWFTLGVIVVAGMIFWRERPSNAQSYAGTQRRAEAMTLCEAERIVQEYGAALAEDGNDGIACYASRLPHSQERIVQAMKLWLAHDIQNRSLTEKFRDEMATAASRLPFFIEDAKARRLNAARRSYDEFRKKHSIAECASVGREEFMARMNADRESLEWADTAFIKGSMLRTELSEFIAVVELFDPAGSSYWRRVYSLAGLE
jgi:hypothetical protein